MDTHERGQCPEIEQVKEASEFISDINSKRKAVAIHCNNGRKRTGTMLAAQLICQGLAGEEALRRIQELNSEAHLNDIQKEFLRNYKKSYKVGISKGWITSTLETFAKLSTLVDGLFLSSDHNGPHRPPYSTSVAPSI